MKNFKIVSSFSLLLFFQFQLLAQAATIEITEAYMEFKRPEGYIIHDGDGEIIQYKKFEKRDYKRKFEITVNAETLDNIGVTLTYNKWCSTHFPIYDGLQFYLNDLYPHLLNNAGTYYSLNFSACSFVDKNTKFLGSDQKSSSIDESGQLTFRYNPFHPLLVAFKNEGDDFVYCYQHSPLQEEENSFQASLREKDLFQADRFIQLEFDVWDEWSYNIMLFSKLYDKPILLKAYSHQGSKIKIPVPEQLQIDSIGVRATNGQEIMFSKFSATEPPSIISNLVFETLDLNHAIDGRTIIIPKNDISYFSFLRIYTAPDDEKIVWYLNAKTPAGINITLPDFPSELLIKGMSNEDFDNPTSSKLSTYVFPASLNTEKVDFQQFHDLFWKIENGIVVSIFKDK